MTAERSSPSLSHSSASSTGPVDPTWYKDAVVYELHVRAFRDTDASGAGDFRGLTEKLDYLRDLGVNALWLLPFYPSPLRDDGYDISDYTEVHPAYGSLSDFQHFLHRAHDHGIRVITELVLNHTSDQHPWFQRARRAPPGSSERDFYIWSDTPEKFSGARVIFKDFETSNWTWDRVAKAYYWHRFYSHQPDLNYDHPEVPRAMLRVLDHWLEMGVDGIRLDAVPYLFKREGTNCENLPETHEFLKKLRAHVDQRFPGRMLLAEANQWPEDAARYFGDGPGDECHAAFHFPLMPRIFMATRMETRFPIVDILEQTPAIPDHCQWLIFLRNHDELSLEMVSDEERDYLYRVYAAEPRMRVNLGIRRRLAPLLSNDRRLLELMNGLLFSLPGTPVLYYGDEIGMGDNIYLGDRNGVRTPMQWSPDRNAGFSSANPQRLYLPVITDPEFHYEAVNVETLQANQRSLLWHFKRLIALRRELKVLGRGSTTLLYPSNHHVLAFLRTYGEEVVLVVANLSRQAQSVDLDLSAYEGARPLDLFSKNAFPPIDAHPYRFTLGPYDFLWFALQPEAPVVNGDTAPRAVLPLHFQGALDWGTLSEGYRREPLERHLREVLPTRRWFRGKAHTLDRVDWETEVPVLGEESDLRFVLLRVGYTDAEPECYLLPLAIAQGEKAKELRKSSPASVLAFTETGDPPEERVLFDAGSEPEALRGLLPRMFRSHKRRHGPSEVSGVATSAVTREDLEGLDTLALTPVKAEQSNTSVRVGDRYLLKIYRHIEEGPNPEEELGEFLLRAGAPPAPVAPLVGVLRYRGNVETDPNRVQVLGVVHRFVPSEGDAWSVFQDQIKLFLERAGARWAQYQERTTPEMRRTDLLGKQVAPFALELVGPVFELARRLGQRTAELHLALSRPTDDPAFSPEPMDPAYVRSIYQTMQVERQVVLSSVRSRLSILSPEARATAQALLAHEPEIDQRYRRLLRQTNPGRRIRVHGDYHLGQVLWTGKDFVVIDLEGEPSRSLSERRLKRSPLRDVAGMLRSFDYATRGALRDHPQKATLTAEDLRALEVALELWVASVSTSFMGGYRDAAGNTDILPREEGSFRELLEAYMVEKAIYEVGYELDHRPSWVEVPLGGLLHLLERRE